MSFPYTNNTPQATQTIASTQPLIFNNFSYLQKEVGQEHNFDATDATLMWHKQASMPNQADPGAFPVAPGSVNGMYYVGSGKPKYYDGTDVSFITKSKVEMITVSGTVALNASSPTTVFTIPGGSIGSYWIRPPVGKSATTVSAMGQFVGSNGVGEFGEVSDPGISITSTGYSLQAELTSSSNNGTYTYLIQYYIP